MYASAGFCALTGYSKQEIENINCRFLQGPETNPEHIQVIRNAIQEECDAAVEILNYKKDGTKFMNRFFICPLFGPSKELQVSA